MIKLGNYFLGTSNNWNRMHGFPMVRTKRYPHERKDIPKRARVRYHTMRKAGCDIELIKRYLLRLDGYVLKEEYGRILRR